MFLSGPSSTLRRYHVQIRIEGSQILSPCPNCVMNLFYTGADLSRPCKIAVSHLDYEYFGLSRIGVSRR